MTSRPVNKGLPQPWQETDTVISMPPTQSLFLEGSVFPHIFPVQRVFGCRLAVSLPVLYSLFYSTIILLLLPHFAELYNKTGAETNYRSGEREE